MTALGPLRHSCSGEFTKFLRDEVLSLNTDLQKCEEHVNRTVSSNESLLGAFKAYATSHQGFIKQSRLMQVIGSRIAKIDKLLSTEPKDNTVHNANAEGVYSEIAKYVARKSAPKTLSEVESIILNTPDLLLDFLNEDFQGTLISSNTSLFFSYYEMGRISRSQLEKIFELIFINYHEESRHSFFLEALPYLEKLAASEPKIVETFFCTLDLHRSVPLNDQRNFTSALDFFKNLMNLNFPLLKTILSMQWYPHLPHLIKNIQVLTPWLQDLAEKSPKVLLELFSMEHWDELPPLHDPSHFTMALPFLKWMSIFFPAVLDDLLDIKDKHGKTALNNTTISQLAARHNITPHIENSPPLRTPTPTLNLPDDVYPL